MCVCVCVCVCVRACACECGRRRKIASLPTLCVSIFRPVYCEMTTHEAVRPQGVGAEGNN